ncbi:MAG: PleD family two-component system response regulator [Hyphomonas sp.]|jgi:two-component system cell cycle response regulator|uniref:PleD family two-component system response regulator n=1 Tax=Hyphomonas sp. TaxID=87 RepID=UPI0025C3E1DD|nr:PleD family two-component system response regulator [Hyphomonas sp.]MBA4339548.1 PleD family two-component system response regulator [Hyphomonas sp.]
MSARILVVDDIEANRRLLQAKLEAQYHSVILACNGPDALEKARTTDPEIILLDVMMPGMDGYEVCRRLKADPVTAHIPVVMVTALSDTEDRVRGLDAGAEDFLTKPVDDFLLTSRINTLMRYNAVTSELRQREASGLKTGAMEDSAQEDVEGPARVFLIDDNPRTSARIATLLREDGHKVMTLLESGNMGDLAKERTDVLLVSLLSKSFDPLKLCAHFKTNDVTRAVSILLICDPLERAKAVKGLEIGASDMIMAPVDTQELLARVRTQTRRTRYVEILRERVDRGLELSVIDQLTGLYNRRYMTSQLQQYMHRAVMGGKPLSVMMLDIDHFKPINDTHGHQAGDEVLQELADRLRHNIRPMDVACRPGGEEFLVILPETPEELACAAAERVRKAIAADPFNVLSETRQIAVTVSAGVSSLLGPNDTMAELLNRADTALYQAKSAGRNRVKSLAA